ncbi:hypothetical protein [Curtobacterium poinsettiae]|nr:hypothetical protein [Curtobacterium flaccumfaciens]MCS6578275.1 hypothetical protein [Curtobacterium flaccumfaciens]
MTALTPQQMRELAFDADHYDKYGDPHGEQTAAKLGNAIPEVKR